MDLKPHNEIKKDLRTYVQSYRSKKSTIIKGCVQGESWSLVINDLILSFDISANYVLVNCAGRDSFQIHIGNDFCSKVVDFLVEEHLIFQIQNLEESISSN